MVIAEYPLDVDNVFHIDGEIGSMEIEIKEKLVRVNSSTCPNQICVQTGWISKPHEQIVCTPNHILIRVKADD